VQNSNALQRLFLGGKLDDAFKCLLTAAQALDNSGFTTGVDRKNRFDVEHISDRSRQFAQPSRSNNVFQRVERTKYSRTRGCRQGDLFYLVQ
jgi:hypothetical protein